MTNLQKWTQSTVWYLFQTIMEKSQIEVNRDTITGYIRDLCKDAGVTRESLGIYAGARAELYFNGTWSSVSFGKIAELAEKGTDIVCIEKQGVPEVLTEYADKYGIALLNSRGHLTEYGKDLMDAARKSGALVVIMVDYDLPGIKIASETPIDMPWIGVNEDTLIYFHLTREEVSIPAESNQYEKYITILAKEGRHGSKAKNDNAGKIDTRFKDVDLEFLKYRRIEIDAILAKVGGKRFFEFVMHQLNRISPARDYNRTISLSTEFFNQENLHMLPDSARRFFEYIQNMSDAAVTKTKEDIKSKLENVTGFIEVQEKKKEIAEQFAQTLMENEDMRLIFSKCEELMRPGVLPEIEQANNADGDKESSRRKRQRKRWK
ncbi:MAG: hypothetical protein WA941_01400 [Nitrososphaeraceae archaeon]